MALLLRKMICLSAAYPNQRHPRMIMMIKQWLKIYKEDLKKR